MNLPDELNVALVGCGGVAERYRRIYAQLRGVKVAVTVDTDEEVARGAAQEVGAGSASTDFSEALAEGVDVAVISTPNYLHREQAVAALKAGKHVFLQKPMARTLDECDEILEAARQSGRTLGIYMNLLDYPLFRDMRTMAQSGYLGTIGLVSARLAHRGGLSWQASRETGVLRAPGQAEGLTSNWGFTISTSCNGFSMTGLFAHRRPCRTEPALIWKETILR